MTIPQALVLGVLQGATEFLPISSSGHLVLVPWLLGWPAPGLAFDAVVHWGTALAVIIYFWNEWVALFFAALRSLGAALGRLRTSLSSGRLPVGEDAPGPGSPSDRSQASVAARQAWFILLGTLPAAFLGYLLEDFFEKMFSRPAAAAAFLLVTAALLGASERYGRRERDLDTLTWPDAVLIGLAQALAILPGISRSGATIAAGLARGLRRAAAARFSFLLATPIVLGAGVFKILDLAQAGSLSAQVPALAIGFLIAGVVALGCIHFLMRYLQSRRLYSFAIYCASAGVACLVVWLVRGG